MYYAEKIDYEKHPREGFPPRVPLSGGFYMDTTLASNVPVTKMKILLLLGDMRYAWWKSCSAVFGKSRDFFKVKFSVPLTDLVLVERVIFIEVISSMLRNSVDAGATQFVVEVKDAEEYVDFLVSDDGTGFTDPTLEDCLFKTAVTTKSSGLGLDLIFGRGNLIKIGGTLEYAGPGLEGKGVTFRIKLLKEFPTAIVVPATQ